MLEIAQATVDLIAWFLQPFAVLIVVSWLVSLFAFGRDN